jgi:transposase
MSGYVPEKNFVVVAETRRKWTQAEKVAVVTETAEASVASVARKHGIASSLLFRWRRELGLGGKRSKTGAGASFVPVALPAPVSVAVSGGGVIEIELVGGRRVRVDASADMNALARVIAVLDGR